MKLIDTLKRTPPWLTLLVMAPILGELVSSHQTPLEFLNPIGFLVLSLPYGLGALLCREVIVRRKKGLLALLLLGIGYAIYEEGIVVHSFFNQGWGELGTLARYGYFAGVNWRWSVLMVHFHTFISIGSSIMLAEIIHADRRRERWLGTRGLVVCVVGFLGWIPVGFLLTNYFPPIGWYATSWVVVLGLAAAAGLLPTLPLPAVKRTVPRPAIFLLLGLVTTPIVFIAGFSTLGSSTAEVVMILSLVAFDAIILWLIARWSGNGHMWDDRHRLALVAGLLGFFIFFCFAKDLDTWQGTSLTGLAAVLGLWLMGRSIVRREKQKASPAFAGFWTARAPD